MEGMREWLDSKVSFTTEEFFNQFGKYPHSYLKSKRYSCWELDEENQTWIKKGEVTTIKSGPEPNRKNEIAEDSITSKKKRKETGADNRYKIRVVISKDDDDICDVEYEEEAENVIRFMGELLND